MVGRLQPHVHVATIGEDLVFLDILGDAYFCLPGAAGFVTLGGDAQTFAGCEDWLFAQLLAADLAFDAPADSSAPPRLRPPDLPVADLRRLESAAIIDFASIRRMAPAAMALYRHGHGGSLSDLLAAAARSASLGARRAGATRDQMVALAQSCERLIPWVPFQGACLFRSFLTLSVLRRAGHAVSWIFGVQTWPFRAHCWLQAGDLVLNDAAERVSGYAPIFVA